LNLLIKSVTSLCVQDITDIIGNCASTHWADRKEGLVGLQNYFQNGNALTGSELKRITDIFTKMFMDSHTKVSLFFSFSEVHRNESVLLCYMFPNVHHIF